MSCPSVVCPFDVDQQDTEYPPQYCYDMIKLDWNLIDYTEVFSRAREMKMKVGINYGPLVGIVVGKYRGFYCFGNTIEHVCVHVRKRQTGCHMCYP